MTRTQIKDFAKNLRDTNIWTFWKGLLLAGLGAVIISGISALIAMIPVLGWVAGVLACAIASTFYVGLLRYYIDIVNGNKPNINTIFNYCKGYKEILTIFLINLLVGLLVSLGSILFIIPGIILTLAYTLVMFIHLANPDMEAPDVLTLSRKYMKGYKADLFVLNLSFIGWHILSCITFGILYIWVYPYIVFANIKFFLNVLEKNNVVFDRDNNTIIKDTVDKIKNDINDKH